MLDGLYKSHPPFIHSDKLNCNVEITIEYWIPLKEGKVINPWSVVVLLMFSKNLNSQQEFSYKHWCLIWERNKPLMHYWKPVYISQLEGWCLLVFVTEKGIHNFMRNCLATGETVLQLSSGSLVRIINQSDKSDSPLLNYVCPWFGLSCQSTQWWLVKNILRGVVTCKVSFNNLRPSYKKCNSKLHKHKFRAKLKTNYLLGLHIFTYKVPLWQCSHIS